MYSTAWDDIDVQETLYHILQKGNQSFGWIPPTVVIVILLSILGLQGCYPTVRDWLLSVRGVDQKDGVTMFVAGEHCGGGVRARVWVGGCSSTPCCNHLTLFANTRDRKREKNSDPNLPGAPPPGASPPHDSALITWVAPAVEMDFLFSFVAT